MDLVLFLEAKGLVVEPFLEHFLLNGVCVGRLEIHSCEVPGVTDVCRLKFLAFVAEVVEKVDSFVSHEFFGGGINHEKQFYMILHVILNLF